MLELYPRTVDPQDSRVEHQKTTETRATSLHFGNISFHFISFHFISFHFISFHFISFHFSDTWAWHTIALLALCETKRSRQNFPLFQVGKQGLVKISTPDHILCKFVHLGPPQRVFWAPPALRLFNNPRPKSVTREHALPPDVSEGQSCNLSTNN